MIHLMRARAMIEAKPFAPFTAAASNRPETKSKVSAQNQKEFW
jgi:hypothetical protein